MLRLYLFGTPRLERDGVALPLRRSKGLALLAHLAATGRPHAREALQALLWAEFPDADARNNLRRELSQLRALLGDGAFVADRQQVAWTRGPAQWVDVATFEAQIALARTHDHPSGLCAVCAGALAEAVQLATAELLDGLHLADSPAFEEWLFFQREEIRQHLAWAYECLVEWYAGRAELQQALSLARRWLSLDPLDEPPRRALMELSAQAGQHAAALRIYEEGVRLLAAELGTTPEPATTSLYETIKARELAPAPRRHAIVPLPQPEPPASFPDVTPPDLPPLTSFIGRQDELAQLVARLNDPTCRLLTLVGPGGIGKTRLANELIERCRRSFADGATLVPLSSTTRPEHLPGSIAGAMALALTGTGTGWVELAAVLRERELLLVLDNVEQLVDAAAALAELLRAVPGLTLLVTSRVALGLQEEWLWPVAGLTVPTGSDTAHQADAVQLFLTRARQRGADLQPNDLEAVVQICRLVGGMPLAIELAAAWTATLSCREIATEVAGGLALLATELPAVPERHRSIRTIVDQTWAQLPTPVQHTLARLSLFPASFTREAAMAVADRAGALPLLAQLAERALLHRAADGRYELHPLVRQYAEERLRELPDEAQAAVVAGGRYYTQWLCALFARVYTGDNEQAILAVRAERDNIRRVFPAMLADTAGEPLRQVLQIIQNYYFACGPYQEGVELLAMAETHLRQDRSDDGAVVRAHVLTSLGMFAMRQGQIEAARAYLTTSSALFLELGAMPREGEATDPEIVLGMLALVAGDYQAAGRYAERVRVRNEATGQRRNQAYSWHIRADAAQAQGLLPAAHTAARKALALSYASGASWLTAYIRNQLGQIAAARGRYEEAAQHLEVSYTTRETFGDYEGMAVALLGIGEIAASRGEHARAAQRFGESLALYTQTGDRGGMARARLRLGTTLAALGDRPAAWAHIQAALEQARALGYQHVVLDAVVQAAGLLTTTDHAERAPALLAQALVHPASRVATTEQAHRLLGRCEELLLADVFAAAVARGQASSLNELVEEIRALTIPGEL